MRGDLPAREPAQIARWLDDRVFQKRLDQNRATGKGRFLLHDGPPYANGNIHIGHVLNKVLKDVVVKFKTQQGYVVDYVPGWDCHGLPIELEVEKALREQKKEKSQLSKVELRTLCREYAESMIDRQREQFKRLEVFGDWDHPYRTMSREYVASIVREVGRCAEHGVLYKGNKPVYWCTFCATALADAEIEFADKKSPSITVAFSVPAQSQSVSTSLLIWTTTPWTLPANLGISVHPDLNYVALAVRRDGASQDEHWIVAQDRVEWLKSLSGRYGWSAVGIVEGRQWKGAQMDRWVARHPFVERDSLVMVGTHVTADSGTGAVHTAPGHGMDDFKIGQRYGLEAFAPIDDRGCYTAAFGPMQGVHVFKANEPIVQLLRDRQRLVALEEITHSYAHCWRCHKPVLFRATPQWFIAMDNEARLRERARQAIHEVEWVPGWGIQRILGMIDARPEWCISRQRLWGVPITVFYCTACETPLATPEVFEHASQRIEKIGPDAWFDAESTGWLPEGSRCTCGSTDFKREKDILDVWFDSGVSHAAVCDARGLGWPADLYLEGSDQHRGWFQTSLLTAVATRGKPPFKTVLTHGFVNDKDGKKMSKSKGNVVAPQDIIQKYGAEILRLWVVQEDYRDDLKFSMESLERVAESYRKIRNTLRFALGNLFDFDPKKDWVPLDQRAKLDQWAMHATAEVMQRCEKAYDAYEFHMVYHALVNFCAVDLSAKYFDILKDSLYTAGKKSLQRRASQSTLWEISSALIRAIFPILSFTAEEAWGHFAKDGSSVMTQTYPDAGSFREASAAVSVQKEFEPIWELREKVQKALEEERRAKRIGHPREAKVHLSAPASFKTDQDLAQLFLVSQLELKVAQDWDIRIVKADGTKCERCWTYATHVGNDARHPTWCGDCVAAVNP